MSKIYTLYREHVVKTDIDSAWDFIRSPRNLDAITPDDMPFEIVTELPDIMYNGLLIEYRIGIPFIGKQTWLTEIKHIRDHHSFVDEQRSGPYKLWYHYHEIHPYGKDVRFIDRVTYILPLGPLGPIVYYFYVKKQLQNIFDYRAKAISKLLEHK